MKRKGLLVCISLLSLLLFLSACSPKKISFKLEDTYGEYYSKNHLDKSVQKKGMAENLAVLTAEEDKAFQSNAKEYANLLINDTKNEVITSHKCFKKLYPASVTKVMTALLVLENTDLSEEITLTHDVILTEDGAVISTLTKGDVVTVEEVLRTMLVKSANDCAIILGEYVAGSNDAFVKLMNQKAQDIGATHTHFVNANGLHDDAHYTTAYDLYLIFKEAVKYDTFVDIISMKDNTMTYKNRYGKEVYEYMQSTNHFLLNEYSVPEGVVMYGGKTGTTSMAKSCLILMTENQDQERFFSVVLGAKTKEDLYNAMIELLKKTTK